MREWKLEHPLLLEKSRRQGAAAIFHFPRSNSSTIGRSTVSIVNGTLYVALAKIVDQPKGGPFGFEMFGVTLAKITNPLDDPTRWTVNYLDLSDSRVAFPGVTTIVSGDYVYLYAVLDDAQNKSHPMILARIAIAQLDRPRDSIRYLTNDGAWKAGSDLKNARIIIDRGATEMSVRYHASINKWIAVQNGPQPFSREIVVRKAPALEGPWSAPEPIYSFPEMMPGNSRYDKDTFCYAAKEHAEFTSATGSTVVTYACNSHAARQADREHVDLSPGSRRAGNTLT